MLRDLVQDLRYGARMLVKNPGFTLVVVLTLALGIGANTALFSVVNAVLLRPLPFHDPDRLVMVYETNLAKGWDRFTVAAANYLDWKDRTRVFERIAAFDGGDYVLTGRETPERIRGARVSPDLFPMLGTAPEIGRALTASDEAPGAPPVAVIDHRVFAERFGSDTRILERTLTLDGVSYAIVGVMPEHFKFLDARFWIPTAWDAAQRTERGSHGYLVMGRLTPAMSVETARAELDRLCNQLAKDYPDTNAGWGVSVRPLYDAAVGGWQRSLLILFGATAFVLLAAGVNVANLLLARASARSKEVAIRTALGAGRGRMIRQLLAETVLLTSIGGGAGVLVALWGLDLFRLLQGLSMPRSGGIRIDGRVLLFSAGVSIATGLLFGLVPALRASRPDLNSTLKEGGSGGGSLGRDRLRGLLVVVETSLAVVLLIGAGLLIRSLWVLQRVDPGFRTENLLTLTVSLPETSYGTDERKSLFFESLLGKVKTLPGVRSAAAVSTLPIGGGDQILAFYIDGNPPASPNAVPSANFYSVSTDYFTTMGIPVRSGRSFTAADSANSAPVYIVNQTMANKHFGGHPIGKKIRLGNSAAPAGEIVGIVGDVKHYGLASQTTAQMYAPLPQQAFSAMTVALRGAGDPTTLTAAVRREVAALDPNLPIFDIMTMTTIVDTSLAFERSSATLLLTFAALAMALASIGIYGVISYSVTQRTREIGVRMALGAARADVLRLVVGQGLKLTAAGLALGLVVSFALTRLLTRMLFGVGPLDPITFAGIPAVLALVAFAACYLPARRAARVDPMVALRCD